ncbi:MAG: hydrogenase maturation protease [Myxococcales bacterium]|nr:hydrogenase maturation protease [Myxococcales bacterium]
MSLSTVVIGIGNLLRRDDGAGILAARQLRTVLPSHIAVFESAADVSVLLDLFSQADRVILIDAVSGIPDGKVLCRRSPDLALPSQPATSSHALSLPQILDLAQALGQLPRTVLLYGIGGSDFGIGEGVSESVAQGIHSVVQRIWKELQQTDSQA